MSLADDSASNVTAAATFARLRRELDVRCMTPAWAMPGDESVFPTGLHAIEHALAGGGLPRGAITEVICAAPSCGGQLLLGQLLKKAREARQRVALIDAGDAFDPASHDPDLCRHLIWVRCRGMTPALQAADLLTRDANFGLVVLDLRHIGGRELRRTPPTSWYRLQRAVEPGEIALVVITPQATVPSAQVRLELTRSFTAAAFECERERLIEELVPIVQRERRNGLSAASGG